MKSLKVLALGEVNSSSLRDQAVKLIKTAILRGEIPPGQIVSNEQLSSLLGISRTPIREALLELQNFGMVIIHRGKGTEVARLTRKDAIEIFETREALEVKACELMIERMAEGEVAPLEEILEEQARSAAQGNKLRFLESDHEFHMHIARCARNGRLFNSIEALRDQTMLLGAYAIRRENRVNEVIDEHRAILEALRRRDPEKARAAVVAHLAATREEVLMSIP